MKQLWAAPPSPYPGANIAKTSITAHQLYFSYQNGVKVLSEFSHTFTGGQVTALTGPSGCGKSTLLYLIGLMHRPSAGEITVDGRRTSTLRDSERAWLRAHKFGFVFQDSALDPARTVLDNVLETSLYRNEQRHKVTDRAFMLMSEFGVDLRASHKPGLVSGGQAQRIALCRALLADPAYLIADEPTGNLDPASKETVMDAFKARAAAGTCVVIATHDPDIVSLCDQQVILAEKTSSETTSSR